MAFNKSKMATYLALIGIIIIIIGSLLFVFMFSNFAGGSIKDPKKGAKYVVDTPKEEYLAVGEYEVWYEDDWPTPYDILVVDENGHDIFKEETDKLTINNCRKAGSINVAEAGMYNITAAHATTLYITEPIATSSFLMPIMSGMLGGCLFGVGVLIIIVSLILYFVGKNEDKGRSNYAQYPQYAQYPTQYEGGQGPQGGPPPYIPPPSQ